MSISPYPSEEFYITQSLYIKIENYHEFITDKSLGNVHYLKFNYHFRKFQEFCQGSISNDCIVSSSIQRDDYKKRLELLCNKKVETIKILRENLQKNSSLSAQTILELFQVEIEAALKFAVDIQNEFVYEIKSGLILLYNLKAIYDIECALDEIIKHHKIFITNLINKKNSILLGTIRKDYKKYYQKLIERVKNQTANYNC